MILPLFLISQFLKDRFASVAEALVPLPPAKEIRVNEFPIHCVGFKPDDDRDKFDVINQHLAGALPRRGC